MLERYQFSKFGMTLFSYIDLFAGCGGLSLGLRRAKGSEVLAVEKAEDAARTFYSNMIVPRALRPFQAHLSLGMEEQASLGLIVAPLSEVLIHFNSLKMPPDLDLVAGGPPCQGFSLAGRRNKDDARNKLVWEFLDFVALANPKFVIIENVVGMGRKFRADEEQSVFSSVISALATTGAQYVANAILVDAAHYGAPQHRPRLMIVGVRRDVAQALEITSSSTVWKSGWASQTAWVPPYAPKPTCFEPVPLADAIQDLMSQQPKGPSPYALKLQDAAAWELARLPGGHHNHEFRKHRTETRFRFTFAQRLMEMGINSRVLGPLPSEVLRRELEKIEVWFKAHPGVPVKVGDVSFSSAAEFEVALGELRNKKHSQRVLKWSEPAHTVVTIPDDYIHPSEPRTFSVRELARMQGFPDDFVFQGKATTGGKNRRISVPQYTQVGNAVSPLVGEALGRMVEDLAAQYEQLSQESTSGPACLDIGSDLAFVGEA